MNTRPKSSELIKSQFADYAESLGSDSVFKKYGKSVLAEVEKQEKTAESESVYHDYVQFLRSEGLDDRERQKKEAAVLARYADFSDAVNILRHAITSQDNLLTVIDETIHRVKELFLNSLTPGYELHVIHQKDV